MDHEHDEEDESYTIQKPRRKEVAFSCILNTEIGTILAMIRRGSDSNSSSQFYHHQPPPPPPLPDDSFSSTILHSLKSLRSLLFNPQQEWRKLDPATYLSPFLDVIQGDEIPAAATAVALATILKIITLEIFDENTPGAKEVLNATVNAITGCRLEKTDPVSEDAVMMRILQLLTAIMRHRASFLLTDHIVCTIINTCFQILQQSSVRGDLLQKSSRYSMQELIQMVYCRLPEIEVSNCEDSESDTEDSNLDSGFGIRAAIDIFQFLFSLLNVVKVTDSPSGHTIRTADIELQLFALFLINSVIELSGDSISKHSKLLRMVQDDLFHHLTHYGAQCTVSLVLSMISSTVLNIYHFLRGSVRLQLEAFFSFVLLKTVKPTTSLQLQELGSEAIVNFCRQPLFIIEAYVNYDCDPIFQNVFEEIGKLLSKHAFPTGGRMTSLQLQAFEGVMVIIHNIADNIDKEGDSSPSGPYPVEYTEYSPFWVENTKEEVGFEDWIQSLRRRKCQKKKIMISADHFNEDEKKGLEYLKISHLISEPPDPKAFAMFFHYTPGLDKTLIGEYLGDPDAFHLDVLREFTLTFDFTGMTLDPALRCYLETFRLPGESQKIQRILEAFSEKFYDHQSSELFVSKDSVCILCYSVIMLNTDQHNPQVKKKMTADEFIRNLRAINGGHDLPRDYLSEIFQSISTNPIKVFSQMTDIIEMNPSRWIQLVNRSKLMKPFMFCDFDRRLGRDMFAAIAGPSLATLAAIFEQVDEEEILHECVEVLFSVARIAQYDLEDTLDELICSFCKFTTLLNPYASSEETLYDFTNNMKPRMATLAVFTIANSFKNSIRGGWRTIIDCLLKLKKLKLLPLSILDPDIILGSSSTDLKPPEKSEPVGSFPPLDPRRSSRLHGGLGLVGRFSHFLSMESVEESMNLGLSEYDQNLRIIQQCHIERIFSTSSSLPFESLLNVGRSLIFAAAGKGQKFSTPIEEEDAVAFCWDLIVIVSSSNTQRFATFWPHYHDYLITVVQFPMFSPIPFAEKAIIAQTKICLKLLSTYQFDKTPEELIFKSINLMWKLEKEILDTCSDFLVQSVSKILNEYPANLQSSIGWKSVLHLLSVTGRHPETYEQGVAALMALMSDAFHISRTNYTFCIDCAFSFVALRNSPIENNIKLLDLMADSAKLLVQWYRSGYSDPGSNASVNSNTSSFNNDENSKPLNSSGFVMNLFIKLGEVLRKTCLARREEVRNHAVITIQRAFLLAEELCFTPANTIFCFTSTISAMVDDVHEKMLEYSRRENAERETRSMEGTLKIALNVFTDVYLQLLEPISENPNFKPFWLGLLRRMGTCAKGDLGVYGETTMEVLIPELLQKMIARMKEKELLVPKEGDDLWEITYVQIQWIAPSLKDHLLPDSFT